MLEVIIILLLLLVYMLCDLFIIKLKAYKNVDNYNTIEYLLKNMAETEH